MLSCNGEFLSLSRQLRQATTTLRPRSGREYNNVERLLHFEKTNAGNMMLSGQQTISPVAATPGPISTQPIAEPGDTRRDLTETLIQVSAVYFLPFSVNQLVRWCLTIV